MDDGVAVVAAVVDMEVNLQPQKASTSISVTDLGIWIDGIPTQFSNAKCLIRETLFGITSEEIAVQFMNMAWSIRVTPSPMFSVVKSGQSRKGLASSAALWQLVALKFTVVSAVQERKAWGLLPQGSLAIPICSTWLGMVISVSVLLP